MKKIKIGLPGYEDILYQVFHEDNAKLSELLGVNLREYGYV
jgi:hypothetical protein